MSDAENTRPMTEDELEAHGYPRNFHSLAPEDRARIEQQIIDHRMKHAPEGNPPTREKADSDGGESSVPVEYLQARERARQRLTTASNNPEPPTPEDHKRLGIVLESALELAALIEFFVPECRDKSLALTHLEDVLTRANRAIYLKNPVGGRGAAPVDVAQERWEAANSEQATEKADADTEGDV